MAAYKKVGELACQMASYLRSLTATVISCNEVAGKGYEVVLSDTVLFPEGGGQPCDLGTIGGVVVTNVQRRGDTCIHMTTGALEVGKEVLCEVDWPRRIDHMQHHSAQHVLTAVVERELGLPTASWALSSPTCYIQLNTAKIDENDVQRVQRICNDLIVARTAVNRLVYATKEELPPSRSRGIPDDVTGPIRLIDVEGQDVCTCCGTHVENLAELQAIQLLHQEPKGNTCRLHFIAGNRVISQFGALYSLTRSLIKELGTNQENLLASTQRRTNELNTASKQVRKLLTELAPVAAQRVLEDAKSLAPAKPLLYYREDVDMDFLTVISSKVREALPEVVAVLACGVADAGQFMIVGPQDAVKALSEQLCPVLEAKGGLSKAGFRAKGNMKHWKQAVKLLA